MGLDFAIDDFGGEAVEGHRCVECPECTLCGRIFRFYHEVTTHIAVDRHISVMIWRSKGEVSLVQYHVCGCKECENTAAGIRQLAHWKPTMRREAL